MQTTAAVRRLNRKKVLTEIYREGLISRTGLISSVGLTGTGISRIIRELIDSGLIKEGSEVQRSGGPGRRETELMIRDAGAYVIGVSLHVDSPSIVLADILGVVKDSENIEISMNQDSDIFIEYIGDLVLKLIKRNDLRTFQVLGIAVAVAGNVDHRNGILVESKLYGWTSVNLKEKLENLTNVPVVIENLNNTINLAETRFGQPQGDNNVLLVRVGTGYVGASLIVDGRILRGAKSGAGLIAHIPINANQMQCECGRKGCLNTISSGFGILARSQKKSHVFFEPKDVLGSNAQILSILSDADNDDREAQNLLKEAGQALAIYLTQLAETVCPNTIIVAGKVGLSPYYFDSFCDAWNDLSLEKTRDTVEIIKSQKTVLKASVDLAINQFLLSTDLPMEPLTKLFQSRLGEAA